MTGNSTGLDLTNVNDWYQIVTFATNDYDAGDFTADQANDRITVASGFNGVVEVAIHLCGSINATGQVVEVSWSDDGGSTIKTPKLVRKYSNATDVGASAMTIPATVDASGGAKQITFWARNITTGDDTLTIQEMAVAARAM
jgi:hypothetical protein